MNRTIRFRGKRLDNGEWVYGYYVKHLRHVGVKEDYRHIIIENNELAQQVSVDPETVGQFTGLIDKNGKQIYAGDIVLADKQQGLIQWTGFGFNGVYLNGDGSWDDEWEDGLGGVKTFEVIGNIFDNPNLL